MQEIIVKKDLVDAGFDIIAERYQHIFQYGNKGAQLLHKGQAVVYVEDTGAFKTEYLLDKKERDTALKNTDKFLDKQVQEWISNDDDDVTLSLCQWYPENIKESYEEGQPCKVLIVECYCNCTPIEWVTNKSGEDIVFDNPNLAQDWIDEQERGTYYLKYREAGRPEYFIISA